ncbi:glycosyltransferase, partial [Lactiplantibacillus plantarum]|nr:glycosyltransferase [Lactiplantibacillus plantarum]
DHQKSAFLGGADALLFPIDWPEPFGLVMIEAMACGTPVVAFRCGSTPEVIEDGATGFLVDTMEQAVAAARDAEVIVLAIGEAINMSGEAQSRTEIVVPAPQMALVDAMAALNKPMVVLLRNGRALA